MEAFYSAPYNGHHRSRLEGWPPTDTGQPFEPDFRLLPGFLEGVSAMEDGEAAVLKVPHHPHPGRV